MVLPENMRRFDPSQKFATTVATLYVRTQVLWKNYEQIYILRKKKK